MILRTSPIAPHLRATSVLPMSPSAESVHVGRDAIVSGPKPLNASLLTIDELPEKLQRDVPKPDDPIRRTQSCTTSHMLVVNWTKEDGWEAPKIKPYGDFSLPPTASVLHYGTECFVSLKLMCFCASPSSTPPQPLTVFTGRIEGLSWKRWKAPPLSSGPQLRKVAQILAQGRSSRF